MSVLENVVPLPTPSFVKALMKYTLNIYKNCLIFSAADGRMHRREADQSPRPADARHQLLQLEHLLRGDLGEAVCLLPVRLRPLQVHGSGLGARPRLLSGFLQETSHH